MKTETKEDHFLPVVADSNQKKFTLLVILLSLVVFILILLVSYKFVPPMYLQVIGDDDCPTNTSNFFQFCHHFNLKNNLPWYSSVYGLNRTNSLMLLGANFVLPQSLKNNSSIKRSQFPSELYYYFISN